MSRRLTGGRDAATRHHRRRPGTQPAQPGQVRPAVTTDRGRRTTGRRARLSSRSASRTSVPPPESAGRRSTGTSPTRRRCWSNCWSGISTRLLAGATRSASPTRRRATAALDGLIDFHLDFAFGESDLIRIQDRDLEPPARRGQAAGPPEPAAVRRDLGGRTARTRPALDEADARLMAHAAFGLLNSTPHSTKPAGGKPAGASRSRAVLRAMTLAALTVSRRRLVPDSAAADGRPIAPRTQNTAPMTSSDDADGT